MKPLYDIVFITTIPAFYKVKLFNEIAEQRRIMVLYTGSSTGLRSNDFFGERSRFESISLGSSSLKVFGQVVSFFWCNHVDRLVVSGWDTLSSYLATFLHPKKRNGCIVESSVYESAVTGIKAFFKRLLLKRVSVVYVSGGSQRKLVEDLHFSGRIIEFGGCGILNYVEQPAFSPRSEVTSFLYVGQVIEKKGLELLVSVFNRLPQLRLSIIGDGPQRKELEKNANDNIVFLGAINNKELPRYYKSADVFVLPSKVEPWGLVVEEALNNGTPVIVSNHVGCASSLVCPNNVGLVFESGDDNSLEGAIFKICNVDFYNQLRKNVSILDFSVRSRHQVEVFL